MWRFRGLFFGTAKSYFLSYMYVCTNTHTHKCTNTCMCVCVLNVYIAYKASYIIVFDHFFVIFFTTFYTVWRHRHIHVYACTYVVCIVMLSDFRACDCDFLRVSFCVIRTVYHIWVYIWVCLYIYIYESIYESIIQLAVQVYVNRISCTYIYIYIYIYNIRLCMYIYDSIIQLAFQVLCE